MDTNRHDQGTLFKQLGMPDEEPERDAFILRHRGLPEAVRLWDAPFWSNAQASFLREAINEDAAWAGAVDALDALLRR